MYKLKDVIEFGEQLIKTGDLDPTYITLYDAKLPKEQLQRLLLSYFCFYHLGASAYISEYEEIEFWEVMEQAAENQMPPSGTDSAIKFDRWPRGVERRHFRGDKCVKAVLALKGDPEEPYPPHHFVWSLSAAACVPETTLEMFMGWVQQKPMMGPWMAFKVADVMERVLQVPLQFPLDLNLFYKEPRAALDLLPGDPKKNSDKLLAHFKDFQAPPGYDRPCGVQEIETVLCKFKSYTTGHYHIGKDIHEIREGLKGWGKTADLLLKYVPKEVQKREGLFA